MPEEKVGIRDKVRVKLYKSRERKRRERIRNILITLTILTFFLILLYSMVT